MSGAHIECAQTIEMALQNYADIREDPRRFAVAPLHDHVLPDVERVVEGTDAYFVIEKNGVAGQIAASAADGVKSTVSSTERG